MGRQYHCAGAVWDDEIYLGSRAVQELYELRSSKINQLVLHLWARLTCLPCIAPCSIRQEPRFKMRSTFECKVASTPFILPRRRDHTCVQGAGWFRMTWLLEGLLFYRDLIVQNRDEMGHLIQSIWWARNGRIFWASHEGWMQRCRLQLCSEQLFACILRAPTFEEIPATKFERTETRLGIRALEGRLWWSVHYRGCLLAWSSWAACSEVRWVALLWAI